MSTFWLTEFSGINAFKANKEFTYMAAPWEDLFDIDGFSEVFFDRYKLVAEAILHVTVLSMDTRHGVRFCAETPT